jgi:hypothetical protein
MNGHKLRISTTTAIENCVGGKFIRADTLSRILAHWRSFRTPQKQTHFIKFDGELYVGEDVDQLHLRTL